VICTAGIGFSVGTFRLEEASLELAEGEYFVLLGPPGSGKSIFLECLCGLNRVERGQILIDGVDVTNWSPRRRHIGYVPQDYALFPHLSVERNIAFGLREQGTSRKRMAERLFAAAELLGIDHLLDRAIPGLSGGERQRVALARALAIEPRVLLLDEPVSALDESTREKVCAELRNLQRRLKITILHVSHNLEEAFSVADRGGVMRGGRFQQIGPLQDLLRRPANEFVARFMRCENILDGRATGPGPGDTTRLVVKGQTFLAPGELQDRIKFTVRPENIRLVNAEPETENTPLAVLPVQVVRAIDRGAYVRVELEGPVQLLSHIPPHVYQELGSPTTGRLFATVAPEAVHVLGNTQP
jgi:ABC-type Fe3+/spermidine/putrescine transport system ATPase subunit